MHTEKGEACMLLCKPFLCAACLVCFFMPLHRHHHHHAIASRFLRTWYLRSYQASKQTILKKLKVVHCSRGAKLKVTYNFCLMPTKKYIHSKLDTYFCDFMSDMISNETCIYASSRTAEAEHRQKRHLSDLCAMYVLHIPRSLYFTEENNEKSDKHKKRDARQMDKGKKGKVILYHHHQATKITNNENECLLNKMYAHIYAHTE